MATSSVSDGSRKRRMTTVTLIGRNRAEHSSHASFDEEYDFQPTDVEMDSVSGSSGTETGTSTDGEETLASSKHDDFTVIRREGTDDVARREFGRVAKASSREAVQRNESRDRKQDLVKTGSDARIKDDTIVDMYKEKRIEMTSNTQDIVVASGRKDLAVVQSDVHETPEHHNVSRRMHSPVTVVPPVVKIESDPHVSRKKHSSTVQIGFNIKSDPQISRKKHSSTMQIGVDIESDPHVGRKKLSSTVQIGVNIESDPHVSRKKHSSTVQIGVNIESDPHVGRKKHRHVVLSDANVEFDPHVSRKKHSSMVKSDANLKSDPHVSRKKHRHVVLSDANVEFDPRVSRRKHSSMMKTDAGVKSDTQLNKRNSPMMQTDANVKSDLHIRGKKHSHTVHGGANVESGPHVSQRKHSPMVQTVDMKSESHVSGRKDSSVVQSDVNMKPEPRSTRSKQSPVLPTGSDKESELHVIRKKRRSVPQHADRTTAEDDAAPKKAESDMTSSSGSYSSTYTSTSYYDTSGSSSLNALADFDDVDLGSTVMTIIHEPVSEQDIGLQPVPDDVEGQQPTEDLDTSALEDVDTRPPAADRPPVIGGERDDGGEMPVEPRVASAEDEDIPAVLDEEVTCPVVVQSSTESSCASVQIDGIGNYFSILQNCFPNSEIVHIDIPILYSLYSGLLLCQYLLILVPSSPQWLRAWYALVMFTLECRRVEFEPWPDYSKPTRQLVCVSRSKF